MKILSAEFVKSASRVEQCPAEGLPEVAFAGRSNVGKSSLINALLGRKKLARTSGSPGHTRSLNFFRINNRFMFCDLPGYGYARASKGERQSWKLMVESYLDQRRELKAVVLIMDLRRTPGPEEIELIGFLTVRGITPVLVATKSDKVGTTRRKKQAGEIAEALGASGRQVLLFSAQTGEGKPALWAKLRELMSV